MTDADELARQWGIEPGFTDVQGKWQAAEPAAIGSVARLLGRDQEPTPFPDDHVTAVAYQGSGARRWILAVQLYSVRSAQNWGIGDFSDVQQLLRIAKAHGAAGIGLNPLHALFKDRPNQRSPYSPNSRAFLNPLYIDVERAPGFDAALVSAQDQSTIKSCRDADLVNYAAVAEVKLRILRSCFVRFVRSGRSSEQDELTAFRAARGDALTHYARFEVYRQINRGVWWEWPADYRTPEGAGFPHLEQTHSHDIGFEIYLQWVADRQLNACRDLSLELGLEIGLYLDLAVGVDAGSADAWIDRSSMLTGLSVGAPPDEYNPSGQNWGLTAFSPQGLVTSNYAPLRAMLASAMRHAGAIRLDHVLGLMRLYVIPHGAHARDGVYVRLPFATLLNVVAEESQKHRCIVIGEDLGTVPEGFREKASSAGLWSYLVMLFEREWDGAFRWPDRYPEKALATFDTHDMATHAGWLARHDLAVKHAIGVDPGESESDRDRSIAQLRAILAQRGSTADDFAGIAAFLADTPSRLVSVSIEDALGVKDQVNVPGTVDEHPNWSRRLPIMLDALFDDPRLIELHEVFAKAGRVS